MAVDIVLYNAVALSVRKFPSKIKFAFPQRRTLEESKHPTEYAMKNKVIMCLIQNTYR